MVTMAAATAICGVADEKTPIPQLISRSLCQKFAVASFLYDDVE
jgi:hypothetical protein